MISGTLGARGRCGGVESFHVTVVDEHFVAEDDFEAADEQAALAKALRSALDIAAEQVSAGKPFFGAEVTRRGGAVADGGVGRRFAAQERLSAPSAG